MREAASFLPALMVKQDLDWLAILEFGASLKRQHTAKEGKEHAYL